ncbi:MAG: hypothetical protein Hyperionvirus18_43 [Hyperionvirus sp.]|uniref:Uncharacterized protein n=1 Tax=Hyperionvirus sp. TaxID=2487770 RepID=A0A3G5AA96_9VIRU|nr:MAG: hypothetical protein Hyperionvirus18_43 [Hyperionvirus sp.]
MNKPVKKYKEQRNKSLGKMKGKLKRRYFDLKNIIEVGKLKKIE